MWIYSTLVETAAAAIFVVPVFIIYGKYLFHKLKLTIVYGIFGLYIAAVFSLVGFPDIASLIFSVQLNAIPFAGMISDLRDTCLNVVLFVPFGIFLPILWNKYRNIKSTILTALCFSVMIEFAQLFTFRATDINDIITNTAGALAGFLAAKAVTGNFKKYTIPNENYKEFYIIYGTILLIMFLLQPFTSAMLWEIF
jgi:glycopeptide antibiotics resistance protein